MARKLTESQRLIRLLQTKFTNQEIAGLLGYKSSSSISAIAKGKKSLPNDRLYTAIEQVSLYINRRTIPSPKYIKQRQQKIRQQRHKPKPIFFPSDWVERTLEDFLDSMSEIYDEFQLTAKLEKWNINYFYYNEKLDVYFFSNKHMKPSKLKPNMTTNILFEYLSKRESEGDDGKSNFDVQVQYQMYPIIAITNKVDSFPQILSDIKSYLLSINESMEDAEEKQKRMYDYVGPDEIFNFLSLGGIL